MNPVLILIPAIIAVVLFFVFKSSKKKEDPKVAPNPVEPPLEATSSFVDSSFVYETDKSFGGFQPESVLEVSPALEVLFEKLPEAAPMEVQAEAPKPKAKPKAKKTVAKKKAVTKK
jgi:hypothetical protein